MVKIKFDQNDFDIILLIINNRIVIIIKSRYVSRYIKIIIFFSKKKDS